MIICIGRSRLQALFKRVILALQASDKAIDFSSLKFILWTSKYLAPATIHYSKFFTSFWEAINRNSVSWSLIREKWREGHLNVVGNKECPSIIRQIWRRNFLDYKIQFEKFIKIWQEWGLNSRGISSIRPLI